MSKKVTPTLTLAHSHIDGLDPKKAVEWSKTHALYIAQMYVDNPVTCKESECELRVVVPVTVDGNRMTVEGFFKKSKAPAKKKAAGSSTKPQGDK